MERRGRGVNGADNVPCPVRHNIRFFAKLYPVVGHFVRSSFQINWNLLTAIVLRSSFVPSHVSFCPQQQQQRAAAH